MGWSTCAFLKDYAGVLFAALVPVPSVGFGSLNIFIHLKSLTKNIVVAIFLICV
jgi:hypothetical protein